MGAHFCAVSLNGSIKVETWYRAVILSPNSNELQDKKAIRQQAAWKDIIVMGRTYNWNQEDDRSFVWVSMARQTTRLHLDPVVELRL